ncbi:MAG: TonB-dependent receptor plug domain-containing protein [Myxococcota bacterium]
MWWLAPSAAAAEDPISAIEQLDLDDLLDLNVQVATRTDQRLREAPGLVTVLTAEDLQRAGCRDLLDALRLLPAVEFATDTWGTVGVSVRGNWGFESKVLVRIDGHDWNETDYGTFTLGHRLPAAAIERIEVIRGPGSAVYGGYASLAVVQVTTFAGGGSLGSRLDARASWLGSGAYGSHDLGWSGGYPLGERGRLGVTAVVGRGRRTDGDYVGVDGRPVDLTDASALDPALISTDLRIGALAVTGMAERYHTTHRTNFGVASEVDRDADFASASGSVSWEGRLADRWTLTPRASAQWQRPWYSVRDVPPPIASTDRTDRALVGIDLVGKPREWVDVLLGGEAGRTHLHVPVDQPKYWVGDQPEARFAFGAAWLQMVAHGPPVNVVGGLRYDANEGYGGALSPRVGLTRAWDNAHGKVQISRAFRAPGFQQSAYEVGPEWSRTVEAELGAGPAPWLYATANAFDVRLTDQLVYLVHTDPQTGRVTEGYVNAGNGGSRGGELEVVAQTERVSARAGWAAFVSTGTGEAGFGVPGRPQAHLAVPNHKVVARTSVDGPRGMWVSSVCTVLGPRWAVVGADAGGDPTYDRLPTAWLLDLTVGLEDLGRTGLTLSLDAHDLLNQAPPLAQPYASLHTPLPGAGRDLGIRLGARW